MTCSVPVAWRNGAITPGAGTERLTPSSEHLASRGVDFELPDPTTARPWWQTAVVYQIYPRSFADGDGDGVGDLRGVLEHLDHLSWLGVDALWLSPIYPSPMADFGYDVSDYCDVDPVFGDLDTFDRLVAEAHRRGIRVILDWVPNHTSDRHPWFVESRASRTNPKRAWYVWRDRPVNNWRAAFRGQPPAWTYDPATDQWYLHSFLAEQPDLDWSNPEVRAAMLDTLRFWLDRGVDGFRMDVVHLLGKDLERDDPPELAAWSHVPFNDHPDTHRHLREIRAVLDSYPGERVSVGEVYLLDPATVVQYYGHGDELHLSFNFRFTHTRWQANDLHRHLREALETHVPAGAWPTWVLSNHDQPRHRTRFGGDERVARAAAVLLTTLPGTPFLYAGEELGLLDADVPPDQQVDPGGRDGCRAPLPWTSAPDHGWPSTPWLPFPPEADTRSVEAQRADPSSVLHLYRRLLHLRRTTPALQVGAVGLGEPDDRLLRFDRTAAGVRVTILVSTVAEALDVAAVGGEVLVDTAGAPSAEAPLAPFAARIVRRD